jgi:DNA-binding CsgD family transcriptional regulator
MAGAEQPTRQLFVVRRIVDLVGLAHGLERRGPVVAEIVDRPVAEVRRLVHQRGLALLRVRSFDDPDQQVHELCGVLSPATQILLSRFSLAIRFSSCVTAFLMTASGMRSFLSVRAALRSANLGTRARTSAASSIEADLHRLTRREREVLRLVAAGYTYQEIGARLSISARTVETHAAAVLRKLQLANRRELSRRAGLVIEAGSGKPFAEAAVEDSGDDVGRKAEIGQGMRVLDEVPPGRVASERGNIRQTVNRNNSSSPLL